MGSFYPFLLLFHGFFAFLTSVSDTVVGFFSVAGVPALAGLPSALYGCVVSIVSACLGNPTVANILQ
jgi:hypothetical protein